MHMLSLTDFPQNICGLILVKHILILFPHIEVLLPHGQQYRDIFLRHNVPFAEPRVLRNTFYNLCHVMT